MRDQMVLFCYAEGSGNAWEAICLDFDIAVQGTSDQDVMNKLNASRVCALAPGARAKALPQQTCPRAYPNRIVSQNAIGMAMP